MTGPSEKWEDILKDANWKIENDGMKMPKDIKTAEEDCVASASNQKMISEENKSEPILSQILNQQKGESKGNVFGGGVHTNNEVTVKQYFSYYAKLANQQNML